MLSIAVLLLMIKHGYPLYCTELGQTSSQRCNVVTSPNQSFTSMLNVIRPCATHKSCQFLMGQRNVENW